MCLRRLAFRMSKWVLEHFGRQRNMSQETCFKELLDRMSKLVLEHFGRQKGMSLETCFKEFWFGCPNWI